MKAEDWFDAEAAEYIGPGRHGAGVWLLECRACGAAMMASSEKASLAFADEAPLRHILWHIHLTGVDDD